MTTEDGQQKGPRRILHERNIDTNGMRKSEMAAILNNHEDFKNQRPWLEEICTGAGHAIIFFPKFHPELNWIERYWSNAKNYARRHCDYTFENLRATVPTALNQVSVQTMRRYARKCFRYMEAYRLRNANNESLTLKQVEWVVKKFKSHRRITESFDAVVASFEAAQTQPENT